MLQPQSINQIKIIFLVYAEEFQSLFHKLLESIGCIKKVRGQKRL